MRTLIVFSIVTIGTVMLHANPFVIGTCIVFNLIVAVLTSFDMVY